jgi:hypothetical protein
VVNVESGGEDGGLSDAVLEQLQQIPAVLSAHVVRL